MTTARRSRSAGTRITFDNRDGSYTVRSPGNAGTQGFEQGPRPGTDRDHQDRQGRRRLRRRPAAVPGQREEFVRYTLAGDGTIPTYVDDGYPKKLGQPVDAVFSRDDRRYVFSGGGYAHAGAGAGTGHDARRATRAGQLAVPAGRLPGRLRRHHGDRDVAVLLHRRQLLHLPGDRRGAPAVRDRRAATRDHPADLEHRLRAEPAAPGRRRRRRCSPRTPRSWTSCRRSAGPPRTPPRSRCWNGRPTPACRSGRTSTSTAPTASTTGRSSSTPRC